MIISLPIFQWKLNERLRTEAKRGKKNPCTEFQDEITY